MENISSTYERKWPTYDESLTLDINVDLVIQINGKKRAILSMKKDSEEDKVYELIENNEKIKKYIEGKNIKRKIYVKNRLVNFII